MAANVPPRTKPRKKKQRRPGQVPQGEAWCWQTLAMLESPAWYELIQHRVAHLILERIIVEHARNAGQDNGGLIVPYDDFVHDCGIGRGHITEGIAIAEALGFLVVHHGRKSRSRKHPNRYGLTFYDIAGDFETNDWAKIKSRAEAATIVERVKARLAEEAKQRRRSPSIVPMPVPVGEEEEDVSAAS